MESVKEDDRVAAARVAEGRWKTMRAELLQARDHLRAASVAGGDCRVDAARHAVAAVLDDLDVMIERGAL